MNVRGAYRLRTLIGAARHVGKRIIPPRPGLSMIHLPARYGRRSGDVTVNISGYLASVQHRAEYQLNAEPWQPVSQGAPRVPPPQFTIEISADRLYEGANCVAIRTADAHGRVASQAFAFDYVASAPALPLEVRWSADLDVQDGFWETVMRDGTARVRPVPGHEGFDRLVLAAPCFPGGRTVETDLIFRRRVSHAPFAFGVMPLWGGQPDRTSDTPRRGWRFSMGGFYSHYEGIGMEFSEKQANGRPRWVSTYRDFVLDEDCRYRVRLEAWPEPDVLHGGYRQRMKWWRADREEPSSWMELSDISGAPLPHQEYAVALFACRCQVEFGPVTITRGR